MDSYNSFQVYEPEHFEDFVYNWIQLFFFFDKLSICDGSSLSLLQVIRFVAEVVKRSIILTCLSWYFSQYVATIRVAEGQNPENSHLG